MIILSLNFYLFNITKYKLGAYNNYNESVRSIILVQLS